MGDSHHCGRHRSLDGDARDPRLPRRLAGVRRGTAYSLRVADDTKALWRTYRKTGDAATPRPADPHVCAAREVRRGPHLQRAPFARGRERPRLVRAARADRRHRALRPRARREIRDVRHRTDQGLDHRRTARDGLGAALGSLPRSRDRARDREARGGAAPLADGRGDRRQGRHRGVGARGQPARHLALLHRRARRAVDGLVLDRRSGRTHRHHRGPRGAAARGRSRRHRDEGSDGRGDSQAARAREDRRHALLLRGADAAGDRRGARRHRVARVSQLHTKAILRLRARLSGVASRSSAAS